MSQPLSWNVIMTNTERALKYQTFYLLNTKFGRYAMYTFKLHNFVYTYVNVMNFFSPSNGKTKHQIADLKLRYVYL